MKGHINTASAKRRIGFLLLALMCVLLSAPSQAIAKEPERLFESLQATPNITIIYVSGEALQCGIGIPKKSPVSLFLEGSNLTSFEMVKAQFDGKEKRAIVELGNEIVKRNKFSVLTEVQEGFDSGFTRIYFKPANQTGRASQVFIFQSTNSFGATLINMTGSIDLAKIFSRSNLVDIGKLNLANYLAGFRGLL